MNIAREPAVLWMAVVAPLIQLISSFVFPMTDEQQGVLNALAAGLAGLITAFMVSAEKALPLLVGLAQAVIAVGVAWGLELDPTAQAAILSLVGAVVALYGVRPQVTVAKSGIAARRA
jgi:nicotinamide riboside transporter PnuC